MPLHLVIYFDIKWFSSIIFVTRINEGDFIHHFQFLRVKMMTQHKTLDVKIHEKCEEFSNSLFSVKCVANKQAAAAGETGKFFFFRHLRQEIEIRSTTATLKGNFALSCGSKRGWQLVTLMLFTYLVHFSYWFFPQGVISADRNDTHFGYIYLRSKKERERTEPTSSNKQAMNHACVQIGKCSVINNYILHTI